MPRLEPRPALARGPAPARRRASATLALTALLASCGFDVKVPLSDTGALFELAEATWFEAEETLFVFYRVRAEQGLGDETRFELAYRTDEAEQPFAHIEGLPSVHTHLAVDCGVYARCGSWSLRVASPPRDVRLRMRYHTDGELTLEAPLRLNLIGEGPAHENRSLLIYGVFDESNERVQWRARHRFPTVRNEEATQLGLRRFFAVEGARYGQLTSPLPDGNPYGYAFSLGCPSAFELLGWPERGTEERAFFEPEALPLEASAAPTVCARSIVTDAKGAFEAPALARKNPETSEAFPRLRSPVRSLRQLKFFLDTCDEAGDAPFRDLQKQRLLLQDAPVLCVDDFEQPGFALALASRLREAVDAARPAGGDMALLLAIHHDDRSGRLGARMEEALELVMAPERAQSSPRVAGVFLYDSRARLVQSPALRREVLWCPSTFVANDLEQIPTTAERDCSPLLTPVAIGPIEVTSLPLLPTRAQYRTFLETYSEEQAGRVEALDLRAPLRTPVSDSVPVGDFGVATFFNDEVLTAGPEEAFSYCPPTALPATPAVFRTALLPDPAPLALLPEVQTVLPQGNYELGLLWEFPYLLRINHQVTLAGALQNEVLIIPFGIASSAETFWGDALWQQEVFPLGPELLRCRRFCEHPTFDSAGIYNVLQPFRSTYSAACYRPRHPAPGDRGFPRDP